MHFATHIAAILDGLLLALILALPVLGARHGPGRRPGPKLGELEVKAYQKIPKAKVAVQLTSDNHLSRELRRQVMIRLSQRGNEVGFSGGNVMRMDVSYFDLLGGNDRSTGTIGGQPDYAAPGSNPRMALPSNPIGRRDGLTPSTVGPTLRITLTLYALEQRQGAVDGERLLHHAGRQGRSCAGEAIINHMFDNADKNSVGDAGCPF